VKQATLVHVTSKRIQKLAKPKDVYPEYLMERTALMQVTPGAKKCVSNNRTQLLSRPKMHQDRNKLGTLPRFMISSCNKGYCH